MGRNANQDRVQAIYQAVEQKPGVKPAEIARQLGMERSDITRTLPRLEEQGLFLSEDKKGRLWPFSKGNS